MSEPTSVSEAMAKAAYDNLARSTGEDWVPWEALTADYRARLVAAQKSALVRLAAILAVGATDA